MNKVLKYGGADIKLAPLISFYSLFDLDSGLIKLINKEYLDKNVFDKTFFDKKFVDILSDLYYRSFDNPLLLFAKDKSNINLLDNYYKEFLQKRIDTILDLSVTTEMMNVVKLFVESNEVQVTVLYYTEAQKDLLEAQPILKKVKLANINKLTRKEITSFNQFYFKEIDEARKFLSCKYKTFYFSTFGMNMNENGDDLKLSDIIGHLSKNNNVINLFNLYRTDIVKRKENNDGNCK